MLKRHLTNMKQLLSQKGRTQTSGAEHVKDRKQLLAQLLCGELEPEAAGLPERYYMVYFSIQKSGEILETILTKTFMSPCLTWPARFHRLQTTALSCRTM